MNERPEITNAGKWGIFWTQRKGKKKKRKENGKKKTSEK